MLCELLQPVEERAPDGGPLLEQDGGEEEEPESVLARFDALRLLLGTGRKDCGAGSLYITQWRVFWLSASDPRLGYAIDFPAISMHAVAADEPSPAEGGEPGAAAAAPPCLYLQLDGGDDEGGFGGGGGSEEEDEEGGEEYEGGPPELRLVPTDASQVEALFAAFCEGAERNPDAGSSDDEGGPGVCFDEDEVLAGAAAAALGVGDVDELVGGDPGRFEDADDGEEEAAPQPQPNGRH